MPHTPCSLLLESTVRLFVFFGLRLLPIFFQIANIFENKIASTAKLFIYLLLDLH
ncbi:hypothetical protein G7B40_025985 [Aetokthonos hydrillicola Thurmond2011]|uniref:Uncharacterized protein n=1 Tax=Aetokthonos hydrillicola Thurmond2011 TaxID=2712845 RepID=A0AAP5IAL4_9CYAN|nr:hypothetical protein [Aetokthonos hydrillicola Thurmond2011]